MLLLIKRLPVDARLTLDEADENGPFVKLLLWASMPLALVALGENIELDGGAYILHNYLNVFRWIHRVSDRITQFRALGRFIWPFWWAALLGFSWYVARWQSLPYLRWALAVLCILLLVDTKDATYHYRTVTQRVNLLTSPEATEPVRRLTGWPTPGRYQALLPLPFYHTGTDTPDGTNMTLDPDDPHCNTTYKLSMVTGLPLMSHKATRAIPERTALLFSMLRPGGPDPALLARLDERPILVFLDTAYYDGRNNYYRDLLKDRPELLALFERTPAFINEQHLRRINHQDSWSRLHRANE